MIPAAFSGEEITRGLWAGVYPSRVAVELTGIPPGNPLYLFLLHCLAIPRMNWLVLRFPPLPISPGVSLPL